ncbi:acid protease [Meira miltonrushii]|uniref:Acid protease n=1 Tax=Meira miltonrushii TaxID=1280837 RepID=A0A316VKD1_9BASI|nr:acid protease [Meira miltonrushii]PWN36773.1 acid protease [Meira miltonrushii]
MPLSYVSRRDDVASSSSSPSSTHFLAKRAVAKSTVVQLKRTFLQGQLTYTAPITVEGQTLNVQVDTGSADFWLAADKCGTASCQSKEGYQITLFRDDTGLETGQSVQISYLRGSASGPIVTSNVTFANDLIPNQAFLTADDVEAEQLNTMQASGVLGMALPLDSLIQSTLSTSRTGNNDSITQPSLTGSLLPGLWYTAPMGQRFFGLGLQRLPSDGGNGNSTITFGDYDPEYLPTNRQSHVSWSSVLPDDDGKARTWKSQVSDLSVKVNGSYISIPLSHTGSVGPATAILSSGVPFNYAPASFLNALYGAYNVGPSADGLTYYLDCSLEIDMNITVGNVTVPVHPLDSSLKVNNMFGGNNNGCMGSFQAFTDDMDPSLYSSNIVLGAPFLRSVYSLYSCDPNPSNMTQTGWCSNPWLGIYPLYTNSSGGYQTAQADFQKVRLQGQQLGDNSQVDGATQKSSGFSSAAKIAVGVVCGFVGILAVMAILLYWLKRRRARDEPEVFDTGSGSHEDEKDPINGSVDWKKLSENERQKARELAMLHGHFVDETDGRASPIPPTKAPEDDWDISSKGYWEARAIKNDYLKRQRDSSAAAKSLSVSGTTYDGTRGEIHEMMDPSSSRPASPPLTPYRDHPNTPPQDYTESHGQAHAYAQ